MFPDSLPLATIGFLATFHDSTQIPSARPVLSAFRCRCHLEFIMVRRMLNYCVGLNNEPVNSYGF